MKTFFLSITALFFAFHAYAEDFFPQASTEEIGGYSQERLAVHAEKLKEYKVDYSEIHTGIQAAYSGGDFSEVTEKLNDVAKKYPNCSYDEKFNEVISSYDSEDENQKAAAIKSLGALMAEQIAFIAAHEMVINLSDF